MCSSDTAESPALRRMFSSAGWKNSYIQAHTHQYASSTSTLPSELRLADFLLYSLSFHIYTSSLHPIMSFSDRRKDGGAVIGVEGKYVPWDAEFLSSYALLVANQCSTHSMDIIFLQPPTNAWGKGHRFHLCLLLNITTYILDPDRKQKMVNKYIN